MYGHPLPPYGPPEPPLPGLLVRARRAAFVVLVMVGAMWFLLLANASGQLLRYGVSPRRLDELPDILTAPFLHLNYTHLTGNSLPLLLLGFFTALRGLGRFLTVTLVVMVVSGLGVWLTAPPASITVGASGVVFGYFGYLVTRAVLDRRPGDAVVAGLVLALYHGILWGVLPTDRGVSWQGHLFGLLGGVLAAWLFRRPPTETGLPPVRPPLS